MNCDFWIGDIIEFYDHPVNKQKEETTHVDRICSVHKLTHRDGTVKWELWTELYPEVPGCCYVVPEDVIRVIEKSDIPKRDFPNPEIQMNQKVTYEEKECEYVDKVIVVEQYIDLNGASEDRVQYQLERCGYAMCRDEIKDVLPADW